ncbi:hypothetical protein [Vibrio sp. S234-5]|uniref:hypothetical protein n=1 Tax=Vibrio sp. S234-5 TaxID=1616781 RepID=UPI0005ED9436|nr:hypothetical protein [Vibrio sp. S234-5]KJR27824.1 hypothetical protein UF06_15710 [Vibrio sp. S234-5]
MYNEDIKELLEHSKNEVNAIAEQSKQGTINKIAVKNVLENLRSILDYHSQDILNVLKAKVSNKKSPNKVYFPYGQKENHFKNSVKNNLPSLNEVLPEAYQLLESIQPFKSKDNWVVDLCSLTNEAKHNNLSKTKKQKSVSIRQGNFIHIDGATNVVLENNYVNGQRLDDVYVNNNHEVRIVKHSGTTLITENNKIKFDGKEIEVAPFLRQCHSKIEQFSSELSQILHKNA